MMRSRPQKIPEATYPRPRVNHAVSQSTAEPDAHEVTDSMAFGSDSLIFSFTPSIFRNLSERNSAMTKHSDADLPPEVGNQETAGIKIQGSVDIQDNDELLIFRMSQ